MFDPWVGDRFGNDNVVGGCRLLILGESHYTMDPDEVGIAKEGVTPDVVRGLAIHGRHQFFAKLQEIVVGSPRRNQTSEDKVAFWQSVAFYNYVPVLVDGRPYAEGGARRRPTESEFRRGAEAFEIVRGQIEPDAVIVCGLTLWNYVAPTLAGLEGPHRDVIFYDDGRSVFARIEHPSSMGFDTAKYYSRMRQLIELAAEPRQPGRRVMWGE